MEVYAAAIRQFSKRCDSRLVACGLTSNLDILLKWNPAVLQDLVDRYATGPRNLTQAETMTDLVDMLLHVLPSGSTECQIMEPVANVLASALEPAAVGVGGTGAQAACALSSIGVSTLLHPTALAPQFQTLLHYPKLRIVRGGAAYAVDDLQDTLSKNNFPHFVLQFHTGDGVVFRGQAYQAPAPNKIILAFDKLNTVIPIDPSFFAYAEHCAATAMLISGFAGMHSMEIMEERLRETQTLLRQISCPVFLECGPSFFPGALPQMLSRLGPHADIISLSDEELLALNGALKSERKENWTALVQMAEAFREKYRPRRGVVIHAKDYAFFWGEPGNLDIQSALAMGNLTASAKARYVKYGSREEIFAIARMPSSAESLRKAEELNAKGALAVPAKSIQNPACSTGLGDSFAGGFLSCI